MRKGWGEYVSLVVPLRLKDAEKNRAEIEALRKRLARRR